MQVREFVLRAGGAALTLAGTLALAAKEPAAPAAVPTPVSCTSSGNGYLKAKIAGAVAAEIDWGDKGTTCTGEVRPNGGVRLSFKNKIAANQSLLIVFGIPGVQEGRPARALPANLTVVREGAAEFFSTQGDDKCTIDSLKQVPLQGAPRKERRYRVVVRGFCSEPARAVNGEGAVLLSRFDFASELHFGEDDESEKPAPAPTTALAHPQPTSR
ncbi:MAG: hypothetical protein ABW034_15915 [Steroidobacteraceae bacterium]